MASNGEANIFLSHRAQDEAAAKAIQEILQTHGRLNVHIFEHQTAGSPYEDWIEQKLRQSDLLLLLYTDPTAEWDWCLYEAGWFTPLRSDETRPVVCLYNPESSDPPRPLKSLQAVQARREDLVEKFLRPLYKTCELIDVGAPLCPKMSEPALAAAADQIAAQIVPTRVDRRYYQERIVIDLSDLSFLDQERPRIPETATVQAFDDRLGILDYDESRFTWGELKKRAEPTRGYGTYWLDEIERAVLKAAAKSTPPVGTATFRGLREGRIYRPILYRVDRENRVPRKFYIRFNPEIEPELTGGPGRLGVAFNLIKLGSRFRWEVIDPYLKRLDRTSEPGELATVCGQLTESIEAIEDEAQRHHHLDENAVRVLFDEDVEPGKTADALPIVTRILGEWQSVRGVLMEELARPEPDREALRRNLEAVRRMNRRFMALTAEVYHRLLQAEWEHLAAEEPVPAQPGTAPVVPPRGPAAGDGPAVIPT